MQKRSLGLRCPCPSKAELKYKNPTYNCVKNGCIHSKAQNGFWKLNGKPVIISELKCDTAFSSASISSYVKRPGKYTKRLNKIVFGISECTESNFHEFLKQIRSFSAEPKILIIGSGEVGSGTEKFYQQKDIEIVGIDVYESQFVDVVCDAHYLPFKNNNFDGVWIQAVLEHVVEPRIVVAEIFRVLKLGGIVYSETPFMQQVHEGAHDFNRFTVLGHRYLFRNFELIAYGGNKGAEVVLAWSLKYMVWSIFRSILLAKIIGVVSRVLFRPLSYITSKESLHDSSSGVFFMGRKKKDHKLTHKDLLKLYKGQFPR